MGKCCAVKGKPEPATLAASIPGKWGEIHCCGGLLYRQMVEQYSYSGYWFACTNLLVGGANLLPLPGLDGAHILHGLFYSLDKQHRIW